MCNCKILTVFCLFSAACMSLSAQTQQRNMYDFELIRKANPWLTSSNAAGLGSLPVDRTSYAEAFFNKEDGGLIPVEGSDDSWKAGVQTESYVKISDKIAFQGRLSYSYFHGNNMGGHYLMDPSYNPINFVENSPSNTGVKVKETYNLLGGISYAFNQKWSIGTNLMYETADYAKRKDPRPRSRWMDLDITAGAKFSPKENFSVGLNLEYERTIEGLDGQTFGTTDRQYYTLVDYGGYFGYVEAFEGSYGYVNVSSTSRPMVNSFYGGALQLVFGKPSGVFFFNELTFLKRTGYYGSKASSSVLYCEFGGNTLNYYGVLDINKGKSLHHLSLNLDYKTLINNENIYQRTTAPGEPTIVEYFGQNEVLDRTDITGSLAYIGYLGIDSFHPKWEYGAIFDGYYRTFRATYYPFYRDQSVTLLNGNIYGKRNLQVKRNIFTVGLAADFFTGFGTENSDGAYTPSASDNLRSGDSYLNRDFEYDTISRIGVSANFRYTRLFGSKISAYLEVRDTWYSTFETPVYLTDGVRNVLLVTLGCCF